MNSFYYMLEQVWLAHKEAGLETFVQIQMAVFAVLLVVWSVGRTWAGVKTLAGWRRRLSNTNSAEGSTKSSFTKLSA